MNVNNSFLRRIKTVEMITSRWLTQTNRISQNKIKKSQKLLLVNKYKKDSKKLIIFFTLGYDCVCGGILSILSIYNETKKLRSLHEADVILCTLPGDPLLRKYTKFENHDSLFGFSDVLSYFNNLESVIIHIPEMYSKNFLYNISQTDISKLKEIKNLQINIMIQNIEYALSNLGSINEILREFKNVTGTTAHQQYSNPKMRDKFGFPLHKLSVYLSPENYNKKIYNEKEDLLIVSPDAHPMKSEVLKLISDKFPLMKIQIIQGLKYEEFKEVTSRAKWALTFGEGLDGYFIETIFSGGISFGVYNSQFFTKDFKTLKTLYSSYDELITRISSDIKNLDHEKVYSDYQNNQYDLCTKYYDYNEYKKNLKLFYEGDYTFK